MKKKILKIVIPLLVILIIVITLIGLWNKLVSIVYTEKMISGKSLYESDGYLSFPGGNEAWDFFKEKTEFAVHENIDFVYQKECDESPDGIINKYESLFCLVLHFDSKERLTEYVSSAVTEEEYDSFQDDVNFWVFTGGDYPTNVRVLCADYYQNWAYLYYFYNTNNLMNTDGLFYNLMTQIPHEVIPNRYLENPEKIMAVGDLFLSRVPTGSNFFGSIVQVETDDYGREMYRVYFTGEYLGEDIGGRGRAYIILQKIEDNTIFYYDNTGIITLVGNENHRNFLYDFKNKNDWGKKDCSEYMTAFSSNDIVEYSSLEKDVICSIVRNQYLNNEIVIHIPKRKNGIVYVGIKESTKSFANKYKSFSVVHLGLDDSNTLKFNFIEPIEMIFSEDSYWPASREIYFTSSVLTEPSMSHTAMTPGETKP